MTTIINKEEAQETLSMLEKIKSVKFSSVAKLGMAAVIIATTTHFANAFLQEKDDFDLGLTPITAETIDMDIPSIPNQQLAQDLLPPETPNWEFKKEEVKPIARLDFDSKTGNFVILPIDPPLEQTIENAKNKELSNESKNELDLSKDKTLSNIANLRQANQVEHKVANKM